MDHFEMLEVVIEVFRAKINMYTFLVWTKLVHLLVPNLWKIPGAPASLCALRGLLSAGQVTSPALRCT